MKKNEKPATVRKMYCPVCESAERHAITYHGTQRKDAQSQAVFDAECLRCTARISAGIQKDYKVPRYTIPIADYNALVSKEIYA